MSFDLAEAAVQARAMAEQIRRASDEAERVLAGVRFTAASDDDVVTAEADVRSRIVGIQIARGGLTRTRGGELARQVVDAVARARGRARDEYLRALQEAAR